MHSINTQFGIKKTHYNNKYTNINIFICSGCRNRESIATLVYTLYVKLLNNNTT